MPLAQIKRAQTAIFLVASLLSGCANVRLIDSQVNSFSPKTVAAGASYRFERLPSQQADATLQSRLELLAQQALAKVGLRRADPASLSVQVMAVQRHTYRPDFGSGLNIGWNLGWATHHGSVMLGSQGPLFPGLDTQPFYWRQVSLIMRDVSGAVVFESHASHEDRWSDGDAIFAAMLDAALQGFPSPPTGPRRVDIEIPR